MCGTRLSREFGDNFFLIKKGGESKYEMAFEPVQNLTVPQNHLFIQVNKSNSSKRDVERSNRDNNHWFGQQTYANEEVAPAVGN
jgi:hypothetical protein